MIQIKDNKVQAELLSGNGTLSERIIKNYDYIKIKNDFEEIVDILSTNLLVHSLYQEVLKYEITEDLEFKIFIDENGNGKLPRIIFEECGFNIDIIGMQRIKSSASRWRTAFKNGGAIKLTDTRKYNTGRPIEKDLSIEEKYKKLEAKMKLLQAENELLKKLDMIERRVLKKK